MNISKIALICGGILSLIMFFFHLSFYRSFNWQNEFLKINTLNSKIIYSVHWALILCFLFFAILSLVYFEEMAKCEGLAFGLVLGLFLFWLWRLIWQITYFGMPQTFLGYFLVVIFSLLCVTYSIPIILSYS